MVTGRPSEADGSRAKTSGGILEFTVLARNSKQQIVQRMFHIEIGSGYSSRPNRDLSPRYPMSAMSKALTVDRNHGMNTVALVGDSFIYNASKNFIHDLPVRFEMQAPPQSGLAIDPLTGIISAQVPDGLQNLPQPIRVNITARDTEANAAQFELPILVIKPTPPRVIEPNSNGIPQAYVGAFWEFNGGQYIIDEEGDTLTFSLSGAPVNSGFRINQTHGRVFGVPTEADALASPLKLALLANDGNYGVGTLRFNVVVNRPVIPRVIAVGPADLQLAILGRQWVFDAASHFESPNPLSYAVTGLPQGTGLVMNPSTGLISGFMSTTDANPLFQPLRLTVNVDDGKGGVNSLTFFLQVITPVNPTVLSTAGQLVSHAWVGQRLSIDFAPFFRSVNSLVYSLTGLPPNSLLNFDFSSGRLYGVVSTDDAFHRPQPVVLNVTADDLMGGQAYLTHSITFVIPNNPSIIPLESQRQVAYFGNMFNIDFGQVFQHDGNLNYTIEGLPSGSGLVFDAQTGMLRGFVNRVDLNAQQPLELKVTANDGFGGTAFYTASVRILDYEGIVSRPIPPTNGFVGEELFLDVSQFFSSPTQRPLTFSIKDLPSGSNSLRINPTTGILTGVPTMQDKQFQQPIVVLIEVDDGVQRSTQPWSLSIIEHNNPPQSRPIHPYTATQGLFFEYNLAQYFSDDDPLTYTLTGLPRGTGLEFDRHHGVLSGMPSFADVSGPKPWTLIISVDDGQHNGVAQQSLFLTVLPVNQPPFVSPPIPSPATATMGASFYGLLSRHFVDPDNDQLKFTINGLPKGTGIALDPFSGAMSGAPNEADFEASPLSLTVRAEDGRGGTAFGSFKLIIDKAIAPPTVFQIPPQEGFEGKVFLFNVAEYFASEQPLQYAISGLPDGSGLTLGFDSGILSGTPTSADVTKGGPRRLKVFAHNRKGGSAETHMFLAVIPRNRIPIALDIPEMTATQNNFFGFSASEYFSDPDLDPLTYSVSGLPKQSGFSVNYRTGYFSGTPKAVDLNLSPMRITIVVDDGENGGAQASFNLIIKKDIKAPLTEEIEPTRAVVGEPFEKDMKVYFHSATRGKMSYSITGLPEGTGLHMHERLGVLSGIPSHQDLLASDFGKIAISVTISAREEDGPKAHNMMMLHVMEPNLIPQVITTIPPTVATVGEFFAYDIAVAFADQNNDALTYSLSGLPDKSGLSINKIEGVVQGIPKPNDCLYTMPLALVVTAADPYGDVASTNFELTIVCGESGTFTVGLIPDGHAEISKLWVMDFSPFFVYTGYFGVKFRMEGLPQGTGFHVASNGIGYGQPTIADCKMFSKEPKLLRVLVDDGQGNIAEGSFYFSVDCELPLPPKAKDALEVPPGAFIHPLQVLEVGERLSFDLTGGFTPYRAENLRFEVDGLPVGSGIVFDPVHLRLIGKPNEFDCKASPSLVIITGHNPANGQTAQSVVFLTMPSCNPKLELPAIRLPAPDGAPTQPAFVGVPFSFETSSLFKIPPGMGARRFTIAGLPNTSGLDLQTQSGTLIGVPNESDCEASPIRATVKLEVCVRTTTCIHICVQTRDLCDCVNRLVYAFFVNQFTYTIDIRSCCSYSTCAHISIVHAPPHLLVVHHAGSTWKLGNCHFLY